MVSKKLIFLFAIVVVGLVIAEDYEGDAGEGGEQEEKGADDGGEGGYDSGDSGDDGGEGYYDDFWNPKKENKEKGQEGEGQGQEEEESAAASEPKLTFSSQRDHARERIRRSADFHFDDTKNVLSRVKRGGQGVVGPVYTYVKTDKDANFKWGVRHNVGSRWGHGK